MPAKSRDLFYLISSSFLSGFITQKFDCHKYKIGTLWSEANLPEFW